MIISQEQTQNVQKWKMFTQSVQKLSLSFLNLWSSCHSHGSLSLHLKWGGQSLIYQVLYLAQCDNIHKKNINASFKHWS